MCNLHLYLKTMLSNYNKKRKGAKFTGFFPSGAIVWELRSLAFDYAAYKLSAVTSSRFRDRVVYCGCCWVSERDPLLLHHFQFYRQLLPTTQQNGHNAIIYVYFAKTVHYMPVSDKLNMYIPILTICLP